MPEPVRTCLGCRQRAAQSVLLRVVAAEGRVVVVDAARRLPGRGAYVHPDQGCIDQAVRRRSFGRALRREVDATAAGRVLSALLGASSSDPSSLA